MNAAQLRETVDLHDLADRLNIKRNGNGNYHREHSLFVNEPQTRAA